MGLHVLRGLCCVRACVEVNAWYSSSDDTMCLFIAHLLPFKFVQHAVISCIRAHVVQDSHAWYVSQWFKKNDHTPPVCNYVSLSSWVSDKWHLWTESSAGAPPSPLHVPEWPSSTFCRCDDASTRKLDTSTPSWYVPLCPTSIIFSWDPSLHLHLIWEKICSHLWIHHIAPSSFGVKQTGVQATIYQPPWLTLVLIQSSFISLFPAHAPSPSTPSLTSYVLILDRGARKRAIWSFSPHSTHFSDSVIHTQTCTTTHKSCHPSNRLAPASSFPCSVTPHIDTHLHLCQT